jgi:hypothetical protein
MTIELRIFSDLDAEEETNIGRKLEEVLTFETFDEALEEAESGKWDGEWTYLEMWKDGIKIY